MEVSRGSEKEKKRGWERNQRWKENFESASESLSPAALSVTLLVWLGFLLSVCEKKVEIIIYIWN